MSGNVLLVEDHNDARELLAVALAKRGWSVTAVATGEAALAALAPEIDILVSDIVLPGVDGIAVVERSHREYPLMVRVVITSFGDKDNVVSALNAGADHLLEKPFTGGQLHELLARLMDERDDGGDAAIATLFQRRMASLPLSEREKAMVQLVLKGLSNQRIADQSGVSEQAVKNSLFRIYGKLGIRSRSELFHAIFPI